MRRKSIFSFINLEDARILKVILFNTVTHNCYESCNVSMDTDGLDRYKPRIRQNVAVFNSFVTLLSMLIIFKDNCFSLL